MHYMDDLIRQRGVFQPKIQSSKFFFIRQKVFCASNLTKSFEKQTSMASTMNMGEDREGCHNISQFQAMGDGSGEDDVEDTEAPLDDRLEQCHG